MDAAETEPEYITARDFAAMLKLSPKTVYRMTRSDPSLPQLRIGGSVRYPKARLMKWLRAREGSPVADRPAARHDAPAATGRGQRTLARGD